jgi:enoyl-CoA hydratase
MTTNGRAMPVTLDEDGVAATITVDDGKVNALTLEILSLVNDALDQAALGGLPVVLIGREGRFCAGFDLPTLTGGGSEGPLLLQRGFELAERMLSFPLPIVAACTGHALAMGSFLLLSADFRVGAQGPFKIGANEVALGMTMPLAAVEICTLRLSPTYLTRAVVNAEIFTPDAAVAAGFLDVVVAPDAIRARASDAATALGLVNLRAHAATKLRTRRGALVALRAAIDQDVEAFRRLVG